MATDAANAIEHLEPAAFPFTGTTACPRGGGGGGGIRGETIIRIHIHYTGARMGIGQAGGLGPEPGPVNRGTSTPSTNCHRDDAQVWEW